jgi:hypothetical protein
MVAGAAGAIILGSMYISVAIGPIDIMVIWWGQVSVELGNCPLSQKIINSHKIRRFFVV